MGEAEAPAGSASVAGGAAVVPALSRVAPLSGASAGDGPPGGVAQAASAMAANRPVRACVRRAKAGLRSAVVVFPLAQRREYLAAGGQRFAGMLLGRVLDGVFLAAQERINTLFEAEGGRQTRPVILAQSRHVVGMLRDVFIIRLDRAGKAQVGERVLVTAVDARVIAQV